MQPFVRQIGKSHAKAQTHLGSLLCMPKEIRQASERAAEERRPTRFLLQSMLVSTRAAGEPSRMGWRAKRAHESRRLPLAEGCVGSRSLDVPPLPCASSPRSQPHQAVHNASGGSLGSLQRYNALPRLSRSLPWQGGAIRGDVDLHCIYPGGGLA